jgi:hypothetical protein
MVTDTHTLLKDAEYFVSVVHKLFTDANIFYWYFPRFVTDLGEIQYIKYPCYSVEPMGVARKSMQ